MSERKKINITDLEIDLGNYNVKSSVGVIFRSTFVEGKPANPLGENVITYNGNSYTMEKGTFDNTFNKANKNYLPNLFYAIIKSSNPESEDFNLMLGYPLDNESVADQFKNDLIGQEFKVKYQRGQRETDRTIRIHDVRCVGESLSSFYTLNANERAEDLIIIDIGGRTTNVSVFQNRRLVDKFTIPSGTIDLFGDIIKRWNNDNGDNKTVEEAERLIKREYITGCEVEYKRFLDELMNQIEKHLDRNTYKNYFTGGGSEMLKDLIEEYLEPNGTVMNEAILTNCNGNREIAAAIKK